MKAWRHAVVLGGSISGLLAARVLAEHFERVTLVERSALAASSEPRDKCPQGRHIHAMLMRGERELAHLFPDLSEAMIALGAERVYSDEVAMYHFGHWKPRSRFNGDYSSLLFSRPLLDWQIAERVRKIGNVTILEHTKALDIVIDPAWKRISGISLEGRPEPLECDLLVDASGRGSQMPHWLRDKGYSRIEEYHLNVNVAYNTVLFERPSIAPNWRVLQVLPTPPKERSLGAVFPVENNRWMVTLASWFAEEIPRTHEEFLARAKDLPVPDLYEAIRELQPLTPVIHHHVKSSRRRYYERARDLPGGFLVLGDALASFNPVYGQGMTVAILQVMALRNALKTTRELTAGRVRKIQQAMAGAVDLPWNMSVTEDNRFPQTGETASLPMRLMHKYIEYVHHASHADLEVMRVLGEVGHLLRSPASLLNPRIVFKAITEGRRYAD